MMNTIYLSQELQLILEKDLLSSAESNYSRKISQLHFLLTRIENSVAIKTYFTECVYVTNRNQ